MVNFVLLHADETSIMMPWCRILLVGTALLGVQPILAEDSTLTPCPTQLPMSEVGRIQDVGSGNHTRLIAETPVGESVWAKHIGLKCTYLEIEGQMSQLASQPNWWKDFLAEGFRADFLMENFRKGPQSESPRPGEQSELLSTDWAQVTHQILSRSIASDRPSLGMKAWVEANCAKTLNSQPTDSPSPKTFELCFDFETGSVGTEGCTPVWVSQVGQRWNSNRRQCEALLQFPWGDDCDGLRDLELGSECTHGRVWVAKEPQ